MTTWSTGPVGTPNRRQAGPLFGAARRSANAVKTAVLLGGLGGLLVLVGSLFGQGGAIIGLALGLVFVPAPTGSPTPSPSAPQGRCR